MSKRSNRYVWGRSYLVDVFVVLQFGQLFGTQQQRLRVQIDAHVFGYLVHVQSSGQFVEKRNELRKYGTGICVKKKYSVEKRGVQRVPPNNTDRG